MGSSRLSETPTSKSKETVDDRNTFEKEGEGRETKGTLVLYIAFVFF